MALTPPSVEELVLHMHESELPSDIEEEWAEEALQRATDLFEIATDVEDVTGLSARDVRVVNYAILAMSFAILARSADREAIYSPFSSERIGSYSYSKAQNAVAAGVDTGVDEFDFAVQYFASLHALTPTISYNTEHVWPQSSIEDYEQANDPSSVESMQDPSLVWP